ncbi:hypothetical protein EPR50_G00212310 [Perca flavescens]|uniref:Uncharacterized protein n=1 Tax=Perca flavescens TaxID=8167 RepID=A0A484C899_PERFV|nr:hypothetical protein EPR50_G00212310 [Perca flavescens]
MLTSAILSLSAPRPQQLCRGSIAPEPPAAPPPRVFVLRAGSRQGETVVKPRLTEKKQPPKPTGTKG